MQIYTTEQLEVLESRIDLPGVNDDLPVEPFYSGNEHGLNWETYASDDEPLSDLEPTLDQLAYAEWEMDMIIDELLDHAAHNWPDDHMTDSHF